MKKKPANILFSAAVLMFGVLAFSPARADFPERPVRFIVPATAGGTADILARLLAQKLGDAWGKPLIVDNKPGGPGVVADETLARSKPDGYTMGLATSSRAIAPLVLKNLSYDVKKDFAAVATVATSPGLLVVNSSALDVKTAKEAFDLAKANPNKYNYASPVALTNGHRSMELLKRASGAQIQHVPYRGGAQAVTDLVGGQVQFLVISIPTVIGQVKAGKLRALGVTTLQRFEGMPDVPTLAETGFPGFESQEWYGIYMPAGVPAAIIDKVAADIQRILRSPDVRERFIALGAVPAPGGPADLDRMFQKESELWTRLASEIKLQPD